jgi:hypothetical protein
VYEDELEEEKVIEAKPQSPQKPKTKYAYAD